MKRILIGFILVLSLFSCEKEKSSLVVNFKNDDRSLVELKLKGKRLLDEKSTFNESISFNFLDPGIYTLEAISYSESEVTGYLRDSIRIKDGLNEKNIELKQSDSLGGFMVVLRTNYSLAGCIAELEIDGYKKKSDYLNSKGEVQFLYSSMLGDQRKNAKCTIKLKSGETVQKEFLLSLKNSGNYVIDLNNIIPSSNGDTSIMIEEDYSVPFKGKIEVVSINKKDSLVELRAILEQDDGRIDESNILIDWYINGIFVKRAKELVINDDGYQRIDALFSLESANGSLGSATILFSSN